MISSKFYFSAWPILKVRWLNASMLPFPKCPNPWLCPAVWTPSIRYEIIKNVRWELILTDLPSSCSITMSYT